MKITGVVALAATLLLPIPAAFAKNFAVPARDPVFTVSVPDSWETDEIEYGYNSKSPDGGVFFAIEYADAKRLPGMIKSNEQWLKRNKIVGSSKEDLKIKINGMDADLLRIKGKDQNGETQVDFVFIDGGKDRVVMLTMWASEEEQKDNQADIKTIQRSIKPIN